MPLQLAKDEAQNYFWNSTENYPLSLLSAEAAEGSSQGVGCHAWKDEMTMLFRLVNASPVKSQPYSLKGRKKSTKSFSGKSANSFKGGPKYRTGKRHRVEVVELAVASETTRWPPEYGPDSSPQNRTAYTNIFCSESTDF